LHHAQSVVILPNLLDLAAIDARYTYARDLNQIAGRRYAQQLALVGTTSPISGGYLVSFGYLIFYYVIQVGEGGTHHGGILLDALRASPILAAGRIMVYEVGGEKLVCHLQVPPVEKLLICTTGDSLILFGRHLVSFPLRFPLRPCYMDTKPSRIKEESSEELPLFTE